MLTTAMRPLTVSAFLIGLSCHPDPALSQTAGPARPSLLKNGGFEEVSAKTGSPVGWRPADWSAADRRGAIKVVSETTDPPEGKAYARIEAEGAGTNLIMQQDVKSPAPGKYVLRLKCRAEAGKYAYASAVGISSGKNLVYKNTPRVTDSEAWTQQELAFEMPPGVQYLRTLLRGNGNAAFDDVSLILVEKASGSVADTRQEPSNTKALEQKNAMGLTPAVAEFDEARKAKMSPAELAWEHVLEKSLGSFYLPRYKEVKAKRGTTAWDYVTDVPGLPRVLLIGDSISRGYTVATRKAVAGKVNLHRAPANCGSTAVGLKHLDLWLGDGNWDLIHFNFGIHDQHSKPADYGKRLEQITDRLKKTGAKLVFASSTPLPEGGEKYRHGACKRLNAVAAEIMARHNIPINDLYGAMLPVLDTYQNPGDCHFGGDGYVFMGGLVAKRILAELGVE
jgi:lysophospholipase L1-like esterase